LLSTLAISRALSMAASAVSCCCGPLPPCMEATSEAGAMSKLELITVLLRLAFKTRCSRSISTAAAKSCMMVEAWYCSSGQGLRGKVMRFFRLESSWES